MVSEPTQLTTSDVRGMESDTTTCVVGPTKNMYEFFAYTFSTSRDLRLAPAQGGGGDPQPDGDAVTEEDKEEEDYFAKEDFVFHSNLCLEVSGLPASG